MQIAVALGNLRTAEPIGAPKLCGPHHGAEVGLIRAIASDWHDIRFGGGDSEVADGDPMRTAVFRQGFGQLHEFTHERRASARGVGALAGEPFARDLRAFPAWPVFAASGLMPEVRLVGSRHSSVHGA